MMLSANERYLFWFEQTIDREKFEDLKTKLDRLGINYEIVNGLRKPAILKFGQGTSAQEQSLSRVLTKVAQ